MSNERQIDVEVGGYWWTLERTVHDGRRGWRIVESPYPGDWFFARKEEAIARLRQRAANGTLSHHTRDEAAGAPRHLAGLPCSVCGAVTTQGRGGSLARRPWVCLTCCRDDKATNALEPAYGKALIDGPNIVACSTTRSRTSSRHTCKGGER